MFGTLCVFWVNRLRLTAFLCIWFLLIKNIFRVKTFILALLNYFLGFLFQSY